MKKTRTLLAPAAWLAITLTTFCVPAQAQTTATWIGPSGGEWNTPGNWDLGEVPGLGTNSLLSAGSVVSYDLPMAAPSIGAVSLGGTLNINTNGFNLDAGGTTVVPLTLSSGSVLNLTANGAASVANAGTTTIGAGGAVTNAGLLVFTNTGPISLANIASPIAALTFVSDGVFLMTNTVGSAGLNIGASGNGVGAVVVINGGTATFDKLVTVAGTSSRLFVNGGTLNCLGGSRVNETSNDNSQRFAVAGGVANLGNFSVYRCNSSGGLVVTGGAVNATGLQIQTGNSAAFVNVSGGFVTNTGLFTISDTATVSATGNRMAQFLIRGGTVVSTGSNGIVVANQSSLSTTPGVTGSGLGGILDINAGSLTAEMITLIKDNTITNAYARLNLSGSGIIYLGTGGLAANVGPSRTAFNIALSGGTLAAKADWSSAAPMALTGTVGFQSADAVAAPHNITLAGVLSGTGILNKTGAGILTLSATNTYTGNTVINAGTLALGPTGSMANSPQILLAGGTVLDVSAVSGASLVGNQVLSGTGAVLGNLTAVAGTSVKPAGNAVAGTLTFSNSLTETGGVINGFDLSDDPTGTIKTNDFLYVGGDLNLSGTNTIQINALSGPLPAGSTYPLLRYAGSLTGGVTNLTLSGAAGVLALDTGTKTISLVISSGTRAATNVTWLGDGAANTWDLLNTSNWLNGVARDYFVSGDNARFDQTGATNPIVNVVGSVLPASVTVDAASNYTFTGSGSIDGTGGILKTNAGTLTILTTNNYPGATILGGGVLEVAKLSAGGSPSSLGSAASSATNLILFDSTLRYLGGNATTDRGATLNATGATLDIAQTNSVLAVSGTLVGPGGLTKAGPGALTLTVANAYAGVTTLSNGILQVNDAGAISTNAIVFAGGTFTMNAGGQPSYANGLNIVNSGGIISAGGNNNLVTGPWSGAGTLSLSIASGGYFTLNADMTTNFTGTILVTSNSAGLFRFNGGGGNPCTGNDYATFDLGAGSTALANRNGAGLTYRLGGLAGGPNTQLRGSENTGSGSVYQIGANSRDTTFAGTIKTGNGGTTAAVTLLKVGTGTLTLTGTNTYTGGTTISNGVLALAGSGAITASTNFNVGAGAVLDVAARTDGRLTLGANQTLMGEGTLRGSVTVGPGAVLSPGADAYLVGRLTITNALSLQTGSTTVMDVDLNAATNDVIDGLARVAFGGNLTLNVYGTPVLGTTIKLCNAAAYSGRFDSITPSPGTDLMWDQSRLAVDGTLKVSVLRPTIGSVSISGAEVVLRGRDGTPYGAYAVLTATNVALPLVEWTPIATNYIDYDGTFAFTNAITPGAPPGFYLIRMP